MLRSLVAACSALPGIHGVREPVRIVESSSPHLPRLAEDPSELRAVVCIPFGGEQGGWATWVVPYSEQRPPHMPVLGIIAQAEAVAGTVLRAVFGPSVDCPCGRPFAAMDGAGAIQGALSGIVGSRSGAPAHLAIGFELRDDSEATLILTCRRELLLQGRGTAVEEPGA